MEVIQTAKAPQVLVVNHDEHDDVISLSGDEDEITTDEELDDNFTIEGITSLGKTKGGHSGGLYLKGGITETNFKVITNS
jgi:U3 small nucleolar ribonucleoprotein component